MPMNPNVPEPAVDIETRADGTLILRHPLPPGEMATSLAHLLIERAREFPDRTLIAEKDGDAWRKLTYAEAVDGARRVAQFLLDQGAGPDHPVAILSGASINHFLMAWGALFARVPVAPVSLSYSTVPGARPKLEAVLQTVGPAFVFAERLADHQEALDAIDVDLGAATLIAVDAGGANDVVDWRQVLSTEPTNAVDGEIEAIDHDTVTRYMFTSGSTGMPKGVIVTHGMSCYMLAAGTALRDGPDTTTPSRVLDWMPWSHVGAGIMRVASVINAAGEIWLDTGKPVPGEFDKTLENLREARPTQFAGAPLGWSMLVDALEADDDLARTFYANVRAMQAGSAAMPASLSDRIQALNEKYAGHRFPFGTSLASTEVHGCIAKYWPSERTDIVGLPLPGAEIKLIPQGDKYELRVRSPGVTPGYLGAPEKSREAFDEDGYFKMGDAVRFIDPDKPTEGLAFAGRVAEEFKLITGTWVSAGTLRADIVASASPLLRDVVVCGLNRSYITVMAWPNIEACRELAGTGDPDALVRSPEVRRHIRDSLVRHNERNPGSSRSVKRFLLLAAPPDPGAFEITDKGYINQAAVQDHRQQDVERLFADAPDDDVVVVTP